MFKVLIIEDDKILNELVSEHLVKYGYFVYSVTDFENIENDFIRIRPDLVLLDINLPYHDGFYLCRIIRRKSKIPIIIISARSGDIEQVMGIELGADDYITKPFSLELLNAKISSALRRVYGEYSTSMESQCNKIKSLILDESGFKARYMDSVIDLTKNEFKLLKKFIEKRDMIISREELLEELWDDSTFVDDNTLTVNVTRIKNRLSDLGLTDVIKTKRGVGYYLDSNALM